jgi:hypothetical protein
MRCPFLDRPEVEKSNIGLDRETDDEEVEVHGCTNRVHSGSGGGRRAGRRSVPQGRDLGRDLPGTRRKRYLGMNPSEGKRLRPPAEEIGELKKLDAILWRKL